MQLTSDVEKTYVFSAQFIIFTIVLVINNAMPNEFSWKSNVDWGKSETCVRAQLSSLFFSISHLFVCFQNHIYRLPIGRAGACIRACPISRCIRTRRTCIKTSFEWIKSSSLVSGEHFIFRFASFNQMKFLPQNGKKTKSGNQIYFHVAVWKWEKNFFTLERIRVKKRRKKCWFRKAVWVKLNHFF